jgi:hypothetical protein
MNDVRRSLQRDVLPYLVSAQHLRKRWFYRLYNIFGYTTDLVAAFAALGVATPLLVLFGAISDTAQAQDNPPKILAALSGLPASLAYPVGALIILWVVLRVAYNRQDGQKHAVLAKSCTGSLQQAQAKLHDVLRRAEPMPALTELLEKAIRPSVDRSIQEGAWPWFPFAPGIDQEVDRELEVLCKKYEGDWIAVPSTDIRRAE